MSADIESQLAAIVGDKAVARMKKVPKPRPPKMSKPTGPSPSKMKPSGHVLVSSMNQATANSLDNQVKQSTADGSDKPKVSEQVLTEGVMLWESGATNL